MFMSRIIKKIEVKRDSVAWNNLSSVLSRNSISDINAECEIEFLITFLWVKWK